MYTRYFGLEEKPFAISPNPRYLFMSERHREALAHLLYGINSDGCFILLTGDVGTGKTTVCRCLLTQLPEHTDIAIILNPKLTTSELLRTICEELGILPEGDSTSLKTYVDVLNRHLLTAHAKGRTTAIIIDEAQNLDMNVLEQLRLLTNLETNTQKLLQIVLIGQPELRDILNRPELTQLNQRVTSRYHLTPLGYEDVRTYILHRLNVAGCNNKRLFSPKAIKYIASVTNGIPRLINVLCDRALLGAYAENDDHVSYSIAKKAGMEVFSKKGKRGFNISIPVAATTVAVLFCLLLSVVYFAPLIRQLVELEPQPAGISDLQQPAEVTPESATAAPKPEEQPRRQATRQPDSQQKEHGLGITTPDSSLPTVASRNSELPLKQNTLLAQVEVETSVEDNSYPSEQRSAIQISPPKQLPNLEYSNSIQDSQQPGDH